MKNIQRLLLLVVVLLLTVSCAYAEPRYNDKAETISDFANVFSADTISTLNEYNTTLKQKIGVTLYVTTVHFLDGQDVKTYANTLFTRWNLGSDDLLLLLAVGEDTFYTAAGSNISKKFPESSREVLFSSTFLTKYLALDYDGAMLEYIPKLTDVLSKNYNAAITLPKSFGATVTKPTKPEAVTKPAVIATIEDIFAEDPFFQTQRQQETTVQQVERQSGANIGKLLLLLIIFYLIFSPRKKVRQFGQMAGCSSCGCGCAPLSWLLAILGIREATRKRR